MKLTARLKTATVPIQQTRCWKCRRLEEAFYEDHSTGKIVQRWRCPRNTALPERLPPNFAEKCELFEAKNVGE